MTDSTENVNQQLRENLSALELNFNALEPVMRKVYNTFSPPSLKQVQEFWDKKKTLHPLLVKMLDDSPVMRFYGAILLYSVDKSQAEKVLENLKQETTLIKIQKKVGHGFIEVPIKYPVVSFLKTENIRLGYVQKAENLNRWKTAIFQEAKEKNLPPGIETLPTDEELYEAQDNHPQISGIRLRALSLKDDRIISKRFYAAEILKDIDSDESEKILRSLITEQTPIFMVFGDIGHQIPAGEIAGSLLENRFPNLSFEENPEDSRRGFFEKIKGLFSKSTDKS